MLRSCRFRAAERPVFSVANGEDRLFVLFGIKPLSEIFCMGTLGMVKLRNNNLYP